MAEPVEPFRFQCVQGKLPPPLFEGNRDRSRKPPGLLEKAFRSFANEFQCMHIEQVVSTA